MIKHIIVEKLVNYFPELKNEVDIYIEDFSEIYLHLIFGDIFNPYFLNLLDNLADNQDKLVMAGELIEYMSKSDDIIQEVVVTTVLERLLDDQVKTLIFIDFAGDRTKQFIQELI